LTQAVEWATGARATEPDAAAEALTAGERLDEALRAFLAEQGTKRVAKPDLWRLVGGSLRLRLTARAVTELPGHALAIDGARERVRTLATWYEQLAALVGRPDRRPVAAIEAPTFDSHDVDRARSGSYYGIWLCEHLEHLRQHLAELSRPAAQVAEIRRQPWWM
jgi:hypothetical protein